MPTSHKINFLLDENVSRNLEKLLISKGYDVITVQELNKRGINNSELIELVRTTNRILITYDKDFLNLKLDSEHIIIVIDIHPLIDENVLPPFEEFLKSFSPSDLKKNIIILQENGITLKKN